MYKCAEIHADILVNRNAVIVYDCIHQERCTAVSIGSIQLISAVIRNTDIGIAQQRGHCHSFVMLAEAQHDHGVCSAAFLIPAVCPDQQNIADIRIFFRDSRNQRAFAGLFVLNLLDCQY